MFTIVGTLRREYTVNRRYEQNLIRYVILAIRDQINNVSSCTTP